MTPIISARGGLSSQAYGQFALSLAGGSFESIATVTVGSGGQSTVEFTSISSTYKHLQIRLFGRTDRATVTSGDWIKIQFNTDTTTNYALHSLYGDGATAAASGSASSSSAESIRLAGAGSITSGFGAIILDVLDYTSTSKTKTIRALGGYDNNGAGQVGLTSGLWFKTPEAITSIKLLPGGGTNFVQYTHAALYGIKDS